MKFILKINALLLLLCCSASAKRIVIKVERNGDYSYGYVQATKDSILDGERASDNGMDEYMSSLQTQKSKLIQIFMRAF